MSSNSTARAGKSTGKSKSTKTSAVAVVSGRRKPVTSNPGAAMKKNGHELLQAWVPKAVKLKFKALAKSEGVKIAALLRDLVVARISDGGGASIDAMMKKIGKSGGLTTKPSHDTIKTTSAKKATTSAATKKSVSKKSAAKLKSGKVVTGKSKTAAKKSTTKPASRKSAAVSVRDIDSAVLEADAPSNAVDQSLDE